MIDIPSLLIIVIETVLCITFFYKNLFFVLHWYAFVHDRMISLTYTTLLAAYFIIIFFSRVTIDIVSRAPLKQTFSRVILLLCLAIVEHIDYLEDFVGLEVIHFFESLDMLRNVRKPANRHGHICSRSSRICIISPIFP